MLNYWLTMEYALRCKVSRNQNKSCDALRALRYLEKLVELKKLCVQDAKIVSLVWYPCLSMFWQGAYAVFSAVGTLIYVSLYLFFIYRLVGYVCTVLCFSKFPNSWLCSLLMLSGIKLLCKHVLTIYEVWLMIFTLFQASLIWLVSAAAYWVNKLDVVHRQLMASTVVMYIDWIFLWNWFMYVYLFCI